VLATDAADADLSSAGGTRDAERSYADGSMEEMPLMTWTSRKSDDEEADDDDPAGRANAPDARG